MSEEYTKRLWVRDARVTACWAWLGWADPQPRAFFGGSRAYVRPGPANCYIDTPSTLWRPAPMLRLPRGPPLARLPPRAASRRARRRARGRGPPPSLPLPHARPPAPSLQLEEDLADDLKWSMMVKNVMFSGKSKFQEVDLIHTGPFGKVRRARHGCGRRRAGGCKAHTARAAMPRDGGRCKPPQQGATLLPQTLAAAPAHPLPPPSLRPAPRRCSLTARCRAARWTSGSTTSCWCTPPCSCTQTPRPSSSAAVRGGRCAGAARLVRSGRVGCSYSLKPSAAESVQELLGESWAGQTVPGSPRSAQPVLCNGARAGGEGATAREVLRHKSVEKLVMVDIDKVRRPGRQDTGGRRSVHMWCTDERVRVCVWGGVGAAGALAAVD